TLQAENLEAKGSQYTDLGNNAVDNHARDHYLRIAQHAKREAQLHREVARAAENRLRLAGVTF
ncbi:MAG: hypothetical protein INR71_12365, partial [Terriglobus roseus]|nr:hypothetical protein [Terriglobus roseus]